MAEIKNLRKAAKRILQAIGNKEKIILYGDADVDGVASVIILEESIQVLKENSLTIYFPDREKEGYGINVKALKFLSKKAPALLVALDCGIGNVREVETAKELGFEVILIEHHQILPQIPRASLIVNPLQKGDRYPFKHLACAGVVYRLAKLLRPKKWTKWQPERFLELVALATLFDQMPLKDENIKLVREGIVALSYTKRPALQALTALTDFDKTVSSRFLQGLPNIIIEQVRQKLVSPLAAAQVKNHLSEAYLCLKAKSPDYARTLSQFLIKRGEYKKQKIKDIFTSLEERLDFSQPIVFEGDSSWPVAFLGTIASKICQKYKIPCFLFRKGKNESKGGVRVPAGLDAVKAMNSCSQFLMEGYGGHAPAAGFTANNENLQKLKDCLTRFFSKEP